MEGSVEPLDLHSIQKTSRKQFHWEIFNQSAKPETPDY